MKRSKLYTIIIIVLFLIIIGLGGFLYYKKTFYEFNLKGETEIVLFNDDDYQEPGYTLFDYDKSDISSEVKIESNLKNEPGEYEIKYYVRGKEVGKRKVIIRRIDFHLNGEEEIIININENEKYQEPGFVAQDVNNVNYEDKVIIEGEVNEEEIGEYEIKYTLKIDNYKKTLIRKINVLNGVKEIKLEQEEITMIVNEVKKLNVIIEPEDASNVNLVWEVKDENIISVLDGEIKALSKGETEVTVKTGDKEAKCLVKVNKKENVIKVDLQKGVYSGNPLSAKVNSVSNSGIEITYYSDSTCSTPTNTSNAIGVGGAPKAIGSYYIIAKAMENDEYEEKVSVCTKAVVISKVPVRIKAGTLNMGSYRCGTGGLRCSSATWQGFRDVFRDSGVDIVGIQEGSPGAGDLSYSANKSGLSNVYSETPSDRLGILSKYPFKSKNMYPMTTCRFKHAVIKTVFNVNGVDISFYDAHFCWNLEDKPCSDIHFSEVANLVKNDPNPAIVVADFNVVPRTNFDKYFVPIGGVIAAYDNTTTNMWNSTSFCDAVVVFPRDHINIIKGETIVTYKKQSDHNFVIAHLDVY